MEVEFQFVGRNPTGVVGPGAQIQMSQQMESFQNQEAFHPTLLTREGERGMHKHNKPSSLCLCAADAPRFHSSTTKAICLIGQKLLFSSAAIFGYLG